MGEERRRERRKIGIGWTLRGMSEWDKERVRGEEIGWGRMVLESW
jgi:hypothetical protein